MSETPGWRHQVGGRRSDRLFTATAAATATALRLGICHRRRRWRRRKPVLPARACHHHPRAKGLPAGAEPNPAGRTTRLGRRTTWLGRGPTRRRTTRLGRSPTRLGRTTWLGPAAHRAEARRHLSLIHI